MGLAAVVVRVGMTAIGRTVSRRRGPAAAWCAVSTAGTTAALPIVNLVTSTAGTTAALPIVDLVTALSATAPASLVPHLLPPAVALADRVAGSRIELPDRALARSTASLPVLRHPGAGPAVRHADHQVPGKSGRWCGPSTPILPGPD